MRGALTREETKVAEGFKEGGARAVSGLELIMRSECGRFALF